MMRKASILVVEDEPLVGLEIKEDLERLGYLVQDVVSSGDEAISAVERLRPELVLMDVRIEGSIDGIETAGRLKSAHDVPVIYLTAYSDARTLERAAATGPDAYLLKPFDERELAANVAMTLAKARAGVPALVALRNSVPLVDALGQAALLADLAGVIVHGNAPALELLGADREKGLTGLPLSSFLSPRGLDADTVPPDDFGLRPKDAAGRLLDVACRVEKVLREDGSRIGSLVMFETMSSSERKHLERSVEAINRTLESLVPSPGAVGAQFEIVGFLLPCMSGSGDLVDAFSLDERRSVFYGIDVAGHGTLASLVAFSLHTMVRDLTRELAREGRFSTTAFLQSLNERYNGGPGSKPFFTIAYCLVEASGDYRLVRAGHPPVIRLPARGSCEVLQSAGTALGVVDEIEIEECGGHLERGDRLLIASDGFFEGAFGRDIGAGLSRLTSFLGDRLRMPSGELVEALRGLVLERSSASALRDDASLLLVTRR